MATKEEVLKSFKERFKDDILSVTDKSPKRVYIDIKPEAIVKMAVYLFHDLSGRFNIASGMDMRHHFEILYHFTLEDLNLIVSLRTKLSKTKPEIDSLAPHFEAANWIERELFEMLGINFKGHPELKRLLLPDEWPQGVYPLRADYKEWDKGAIRDRGV